MSQELREDLERITGQRAMAENETMTQVLGRLDARAVEPDTPETPDRLKHYLSQRSYVKALAWLDQPDMPHHP